MLYIVIPIIKRLVCFLIHFLLLRDKKSFSPNVYNFNRKTKHLQIEIIPTESRNINGKKMG